VTRDSSESLGSNQGSGGNPKKEGYLSERDRSLVLESNLPSTPFYRITNMVLKCDDYWFLQRKDKIKSVKISLCKCQGTTSEKDCRLVGTKNVILSEAG